MRVTDNNKGWWRDVFHEAQIILIQTIIYKKYRVVYKLMFFVGTNDADLKCLVHLRKNNKTFFSNSTLVKFKHFFLLNHPPSPPKYNQYLRLRFHVWCCLHVVRILILIPSISGLNKLQVYSTSEWSFTYVPMSRIFFENFKSTYFKSWNLHNGTFTVGINDIP